MKNLGQASLNRVGLRLAFLLAAALVIPACGRAGPVGFTGAQGIAGPTGENHPLAVWTDAINISQQVVLSDENAYGQQAVFTPDGRLHVVYFAYDFITGEDQLYYTSSTGTYTDWDAPVKVTDQSNGPMGFHLAAASNNTANIAFWRNNVGTDLIYSRNSAGLRLTFTETLVFTETYDTYEIFSARLLMRGATPHVVWTGYDGNDYYHYSNSGAGWPTTTPVNLEDPNRSVDFNHYSFSSDTAGNFHLVYYIENEQRYVVYRPLPTAAGSIGSSQIVNTPDTETLSFDLGAPIVQFDGGRNVYVFWRRWQADAGPDRAIMCNIKGATTATFNSLLATIATVDLNGNGIGNNDFAPIFDVQVASDGRIHIVWKTNFSVGTNDLYPLYYRTKDPAVNASVGWNPAQVTAWLQDSLNSDSWSGGVHRSALVRGAADGTIHVFYADEEYDYVTDGDFSVLRHTYLPPGGTVWHPTGSLSLPTVNVAYANNAWCYFLDAGVESDGSPYALFTADPYSYSYAPGDVLYTHRFDGEWSVASDVNGPDHADAYGDFWVGRDLGQKLHAIWQQEVDPFNFSSTYDLMHSNCPIPSRSFWTPPSDLLSQQFSP